MLALLPPAYLLLCLPFSSSSLYMEGESSHGRPFSPPEFRTSSLPSSFSIIPSHIFILSLPWPILLMLKVKDGRHFSVATHILAPFFLREAIRLRNMSPLPSTREWLDKSEPNVLKFENVPKFPRRIVWNRLLGSLVSITKMEAKNLYFSSKLPMATRSCLENPMDRGAWWAAVHGVANSWKRLSDFTFAFHLHALEKEMATHSSVLAWRIPGTGKPGGLPSLGLHRVGHDWSDLAAAAAVSSQEMLLA